MPTDDQQVLVTGIASTPSHFTIPGNGQIRPKTIFAFYGGASAGTPYLPALKITSDGGELIGIYAPCSTVAAGGSAAVTWFPEVDECCCQNQVAAVTSLVSPAGTLSVRNPSGPTVGVDMPQTGVTAGAYGDASDAVTITVDAVGRITAAASAPISGGGTVVASDGWVPDTTETWTYASFAAGPPAVGTFTILGDVRTKYTAGTRIRLSQTTTKYFVVSKDSTFDGTNTTVTVTGGTDYTLANAAITANSHSYVANPQGYPGWFAFNSGLTGTASVAGVTRFAVVGRQVTLELDLQAVTSNATTKTIQVPLTPANIATAQWISHATVEDNGLVLATPGEIVINANTNTASLYKDCKASAWTAANSWFFVSATIMYEI